MPPPRYRAYALPGVAPLVRARWALALRRAPVMTVEEHAAAVGVGELEEIVGCALCGERRVRALFYVRPGRAPRRRYHVVRCTGCGFLYRHPGIRPERLGDLYGSGQYGTFLTGHYAGRRRRRYRLVMNAFAPLFADGAGRRLLDYGSGAGLFLELADRRGFDGYGVDLAPDAVEYARTRPGGANSFHGSPREVPEIAAGGFDVITLWSVLAHLPSPVDDLTMLRELLTEDGVLLILTVNANSLDLKAKRAHWGGFTPNHLKFFAPTTLGMLLERAGFGAMVIRPMLPDHVASGRASLTERQLRRMRRNVSGGGNQGNMLRAVAFVDPAGPARWSLQDDALMLGGRAAAPAQASRKRTRPATSSASPPSATHARAKRSATRRASLPSAKRVWQ
jgi:2-polyprenyl-3-methyl-5-hydroxy-6-metoxy-1,4-benzoquinol methylase